LLQLNGFDIGLGAALAERRLCAQTSKARVNKRALDEAE
jgi:hypothetical protein